MSKLRNYLKKRLLKYDSVYKEGVEFSKNSCYPSGHYYSPIVSVEHLNQTADKVFKRFVESIPGIDLNTNGQLELLKEFKNIYESFPYVAEQKKEFRFYLNNEFFFATDAVVLFFFLKYLNPKRMIEIGSGFSSALMLDTCEDTSLTFIEPNPERLNSLLNSGDTSRAEILKANVQDVDLSIFTGLEKGDILFIDSSHVSKTGSDLNTLIFDILPQLNPGVIIHFHDIFYPFEYPKKWVLEGRNWNEAYLVKAFLMHNKKYKVRFFNHQMTHFHPNEFQYFDACMNDSGSSLWIEKILK